VQEKEGEWLEYGLFAQAGDTVTMEVNTKQGLLSFYLNDRDMGTAFESEYL
jgi:hypothetical protein